MAPSGSEHPGYWMHETSGVLRPAVMAYLTGAELQPDQVAALRAYLRQWIMAPAWDRLPGGDTAARVWLGELRARIDHLVDRESIAGWLAEALDGGIDPL